MQTQFKDKSMLPESVLRADMALTAQKLATNAIAAQRLLAKPHDLSVKIEPLTVVQHIAQTHLTFRWNS